MRRTALLLTVILTAVVLCSCSEPSPRMKELMPNVSSYMHIAEYADENLRIPEYETSEDHYLIMLKDIEDIGEISADVRVAMEDYTYFWIEDTYVQFWNDETKTEGILCAFDAKPALKDLKSWYDGVQIEKLDENCYLVGQLYYI